MTHFQYFLALALFILGNSFIILYALLYKTYRFRFLKYLVFHILFSFLIVVLQIGKLYTVVNARQFFQTYSAVQLPLAGLFIIMLTATYALFVFSLYENGVSRSKKAYLFILFLSVALICVASDFFFFMFGYIPILQATEFFYAAALVLSSLLLILDKKISPSPANRRAVRLFGLCYLIWSVPFIIHLVVPLAPSLYIYLFCQTTQFIFPYIWFKHSFLKHHTLGIAYLRDRDCLDRIYQDKRITSREREIIELILQGKSNREIQKELFISIYTVKNHVQNIYAKLGVRSRMKLIQMVLDSQHLIST
jgi:DNA-binding CsgD family transcriptional regulator